jgi:CysZ protein
MTRRFALDFHQGAMFWVAGWRHLFRHRKLLVLATLPILISVAAAAGLLWLLWVNLPAWVQLLVGWMTASSGWVHELLYYPLLVSGALLAFFASVYVIYLSQSLIAVPFYTMLSERTLEQFGKKRGGPRTWREWTIHSWRMLRASLLKFLLLLFIGLILFVFSFVPVLNIFSLSGALMILALDCMDYSLEALGLDFRRRIRYFRRNLAQWLGMAFGLGLTLLIPGLTLLIIPGAVVGAAIIVKSENQ